MGFSVPADKDGPSTSRDIPRAQGLRTDRFRSGALHPDVLFENLRLLDRRIVRRELQGLLKRGGGLVVLAHLVLCETAKTLS